MPARRRSAMFGLGIPVNLDKEENRMKKFLAIYMAPVGSFDEMMKNPDPAKMKETMLRYGLIPVPPS